MSFLVDGNVLAAAISTVVKVIGKTPESLILSNNSSKPNQLSLKGYGDSRYISHDFPAVNVKGKFKIGVPVDRLTFIAQKRTALQFTPSESGGSLSYTALSGSYKGHIETIETTPIEFPSIDTSAAKSMSQHLKSALFELFPLVALSPMFVSMDMMLFIDIEDTVIRIAAADNFHAALAESGTIDKTKEKRVKSASHTFPFKYVSIISTAFTKGSKIDMLLDEAHLHLYNDTTRISLPLMDMSSESINMEAIKKYFTRFSKQEPDANFDVDIDAVQICLNNMNGIKDIEKSSELRVRIANNRFHMHMDSKHGSISDAIDVVNRGPDKAELKLEPSTIQDILDKIKGSCNVRFFNKQHIFLDSKTSDTRAKYIAVGIQDTTTNKKSKEK